MKVIPIIGPISGAVSLAFVAFTIQQSGVTISAEMLITIVINVAIVALVFGRTQQKLENLKESIEELKKRADSKIDSSGVEHLEELITLKVDMIDEKVDALNKRVEGIASRAHTLANWLTRLLSHGKLTDEDESHSGDKN